MPTARSANHGVLMVMPMAGRDLARRLKALEQARVLPDERPMIAIVVTDGDRIVRQVTVPMGLGLLT